MPESKIEKGYNSQILGDLCHSDKVRLYLTANLEKESFKLNGLFSFMTLITYYDCGEILVR